MIEDRVATIRERVETHLNPESIEITDESDLHKGHAGAAGGGGHFNLRIISTRFSNKPLLERHRMVYQAIDDLMPAEIHALRIQALAPEEL